jgi:hypothetical protein
MACNFCGSEKQTEFNTEMNVHLRGLKSIDSPGILLFPRVLVCLDCGFSRFTMAETELWLLATGTHATESSIVRRSVDHCHHQRCA